MCFPKRFLHSEWRNPRSEWRILRSKWRLLRSPFWMEKPPFWMDLFGTFLISNLFFLWNSEWFTSFPKEWNHMHSEWRCPFFSRVFVHSCGWIGQGYKGYLYPFFLQKNGYITLLHVEISFVCFWNLLFATGIWIGVFSCVGFLIWKLSCNECKANQSQNWDCPSFFLILRCRFLGKRRMNNNT